MKKSFLIILVFILTSCSHKKVDKANNEYEYYAWITSDFKNGHNIMLSMQSQEVFSSGGYSIKFNQQNYGKFVTLSPYIQSPRGVTTHAVSPAHGRLSLEKSDEYHLIFFFGDNREEFLLTNKENLIQIKPLTKTRHILFDINPVRLLPKNTLTIKMQGNKKLPDEMKKRLIELNTEPVVLPLGNYHRFNLTSYSKSDKSAHISTSLRRESMPSPSNSSTYYFYEVKKNFKKIENFVKTYNRKRQPTSSKYRYEYNFDIQKIVSAKKSSEPMLARLSNNRNPFKNSSKESITFQIKKPEAIKITITDVSGEEVREIFLKCDASGTYSYHWDGIKADKTNAKPGVYFYSIVAGAKIIHTNRFILKK